jgi:hypothetical protein
MMNLNGLSPSGFEEGLYTTLELAACIEEENDAMDGSHITNVYGSNEPYDFVSLYGRMDGGECEILHDFDSSETFKNIFNQAKTFAQSKNLELLNHVPAPLATEE